MRGGLFNWRYYFWLIPLDVAVVLFLIARSPLNFNEVIRWIILALISHAAMAIPFVVFKKLSWITESIKREICAMIFVGLVRGFAILDFGLLMDLPQIEPYLLRPLNSAAVVPTWFVITHFLIGSRRNFAEDYRALYLKIIREKLERIGSTNSTINISEIELRIEQTLAPLRAKIEELHGSRISPARLAEEAMIIQSHVEEKIRPLSHELWQKRLIRAPTLNVLRLFLIIVYQTRLPIGATMVPISVFSIVGSASFMKISEAFIYGAVNLSSYILIYLIYHYTFLLTAQHAFNNSLTFLTCLFFPLLVTNLIGKVFQFTPMPILAQIISTCLFFALLLSFSASVAVSHYHQEIMLILRQQLEKVMIHSNEEESGEIASRFAKYLHGEVQSELLSASLIMNQAAQTQNNRLGRKGIERTSEILRRSHSEYVVGTKILPEEKIQKIVDAWAGIAEVEITIQEGISAYQDILLVFSEVIEELVSNSVRHGNANVINIELALIDGVVKASFIDNGGVSKSKKRGMGSQLLLSKIEILKSESTQEGNVLHFKFLE